ncbi:MAG: pilus assembly protein TadG-related protein, partial [Verrucomicrobiota bacterium]
MLRLPRPHLKLPVRRTGTHDHDELAMSRGQILVLFVLSLTMLIGIMGLAIDVSFAWLNEIRVQNAADAAALAGAVYLPDNVSGGTSASQAVAVQNGYTNGSNNGTGTVVVNAQQDPIPYQMDVTISA